VHVAVALLEVLGVAEARGVEQVEEREELGGGVLHGGACE